MVKDWVGTELLLVVMFTRAPVRPVKSLLAEPVGSFQPLGQMEEEALPLVTPFGYQYQLWRCTSYSSCRCIGIGMVGC